METEILQRHAGEIARFCGEEAVLLEYGAGAGRKTEILIDALNQPRLYVPIDIAGDFLDARQDGSESAFPISMFYLLSPTSTTISSCPICRPGAKPPFFPVRPSAI